MEEIINAPTPPQDWRSGIPWEEPRVVVPPSQIGGVPSDAVILFDGTDMSAWDGAENWVVRDGYVTVGSGSANTKQRFGSIQLHVEFATPEKVSGSGQARGNSGIYLMDRSYEVQILDSFGNKTYFDGQCGAIYCQHPPLVNVCAKPGQWQTYDILFNRPRLRIEGDRVVEVLRPAFFTVFQNGVLVQNHTELLGQTGLRFLDDKGNVDFSHPPEYGVHGETGVIQLQDHGNPTRFRNIWVREIPDENLKPAKSS